MRIASSLHKNFLSIGLFVFFSLLLLHIHIYECLPAWECE